MIKKYLLTAIAILLVLGGACIASDLVIESKTQSYSEKDNKIKFNGDVKVTLDDIHIVGDKADVTVKNDELDTATFYDKPYAYQVKDNKKREVKANILKMSLITKVVRAEGNTQTVITEGKTPIAMITADEQEYDTKTNVMTAKGGVIIKYQDLDAFSDKAVIKTKSNGELEKIDLYGNAKIKEKSNNAEADHFCYNTLTEELAAFGHTMSEADMGDGKMLKIKANYQQFAKKENIFTSGGNVQVWYEDYYAKSPKMVVYPDKKTNKFNEIYFTGRSSITQEMRTIYADKIKMVIEPKDFYAEGNTRTVIRNIKSDSFGDKK